MINIFNKPIKAFTDLISVIKYLIRLEEALGYTFNELIIWANDLQNDEGDIKITTAGKGIVLTNAAGTVTKRVRLNDAGNGLLYEDE